MHDGLTKTMIIGVFLTIKVVATKLNNIFMALIEL